MKYKTSVPVLFAALLLLAGCQSLFTGIVTFRDVRDAALKDWAEASHAGQTTPAIDAKVIAADAKVQQAAKVLQDALIAYKANGDAGTYEAALMAMRGAIGDLVDLVVPLVTPAKATSLKTLQAKASKP